MPERKLSVLMSLATRYNVEPAKLLDTLKNTVFKNSTEAQLMALCIVADQYQLNPFTKQIYAFPDKGGGIVPVIGVDGWLKMMNEHPQFDGVEIDIKEDQTTGKPYSCTATIHVKNRKFPTTVTEHLSECARNTDPWNKQPRRMLRHRAIIQCIRVAFGFSAMDPEEADALQAATPANPGRPDFGPATVTSEPAPTHEAPRRGRPPKAQLPAVTPVEATVTPVEPLPASESLKEATARLNAEADAKIAAAKAAAPTQPAAQPPQSVNFLKGVRGLLALESITEAELLDFGRDQKGWDDSLSSLEEVAMTAPSKLEQAYNEWSAIAKAIKAARA